MILRLRSFALMLGLMTLASFPLWAQGSAEHAATRMVEVDGTGIAHGAPDLAVVRLGVEEQSSDLKTALSETTTTMNAVLRALKDAGVAPSDIATVSYEIGQNAVPPPGEQSAGRPPLFRVVDIVAATVRNLDRLGDVLDGGVAAGANEVQGISFAIADPKELEREARVAAYREARARAEQLAKLAGATLGEPIRIQESGGVASAPVLRAAVYGAPPVSTGELDVTVSLHVVFALSASK